MFSVPILIIIFNRPEVTARVFAEIKKIKPNKLFVVADGPRPDNLSDQENCRLTRDLIKNGIDWDCDLHLKFFDFNHGCGRAPYLGIDWFFQNVEEGIILEDDCLPHPSFFQFCEELLERYRSDQRVMMISGDNFQRGVKRGGASYYFSHYNHTWGWASWRRAWRFYDFDMKDFPQFKKDITIASIWRSRLVQKFWLNIFADVYSNDNKDYWDHQWTYAIWKREGLACLPNVNLISNIGFGSAATHTFFKGQAISAVPLEAMQFSLVHPGVITANTEADEYENKYVFKINLFRTTLVAIAKKTGVFDFVKKFYFWFSKK